MNKLAENIAVFWSDEDECFIATIQGSDLIGCGDSKQEAIEHLKRHILDELETPRKKKILVHQKD